VIYEFARLVREHDPDIICGFDVMRGGIGFILKRANELELKAADGQSLKASLSRVSHWRHPKIEREDAWGAQTTSDINIIGRITLNLWRIAKNEVSTLRIYSFENIASKVLKRRHPHFSSRVLSRNFLKGGRDMHRCLRYRMIRVDANLALMEALEVIGVNSELARVYGIDFYSVLSRGSQYRVESMMYRLSKPHGFLLISPNRAQVQSQPAIEDMALVMEPQSGFYTSPVVVLDFRSLYPSVIIAYNICYSTCLGKVSTAANKRLGFTSEYTTPMGDLFRMARDGELYTAPNKVMYAKASSRKGILPRMLREILDTRVMVKSTMKRVKANGGKESHHYRSLDARQLALKLLANVTYGYTSAGYSGRMPCAEIADSIVSLGRETLERAIAQVHSNSKWGGRVVYGDTDSLFVEFKGKTREQAFDIGAEIAHEVTRRNPWPVKLQFEKVYHPCVLVTKKRYAGFMYENKAQTSPDFDAKGIETVRRDGCIAGARTLEKAMRMLFTTKDLSRVRRYVDTEMGKILSERVNLHDFVFAKEVRLGTYKANLPPAALVATRSMALDPRMEPQHGERVPFVVVYGGPGSRLQDMVVSPQAVQARPDELRLNAHYYINKILLPALDRILSLAGGDVRLWLSEMPRSIPKAPRRVMRPSVNNQSRGAAPMGMTSGQHTIANHFLRRSCVSCDELVNERSVFCQTCSADPQRAHLIFMTKLTHLQEKRDRIISICMECCGERNLGLVMACDALDCKVSHARARLGSAVENMASLEPLLQSSWALEW